MSDERQGRLFEIDASEFAPLAEVNLPATCSHSERAAEFDRLNPHVMRLAIRVALWARGRGLAHYGIGAVWEILRFKAIETVGDTYKLNNNYRAWYAREAMKREPLLDGFFECRDSPHDPNYYSKGGE